MQTWIGSEFSFSFNGDFSGKVEIKDMMDTSRAISISGKELLEFVAYCYVARNRISAAEQAEYKELLK